MYFDDFHECTVEMGTDSASAKAVVPPNSLMISETSMPHICANRKDGQEPIAESVIYGPETPWHSKRMINTSELLEMLRQQGIPKGKIAKALGINPSRITDLFDRKRKLSLDEAVILMEAFDLEEPQPAPVASPVPAQVTRLIVQYVAQELGCPLEDNEALIEDLSQDVRAFSELVVDPRYRHNIEAAEAFFQAMRLRRPKSEQEARLGNGRDPAH
jgi:hypothetical protein